MVQKQSRQCINDQGGYVLIKLYFYKQAGFGPQAIVGADPENCLDTVYVIKVSAMGTCV